MKICKKINLKILDELADIHPEHVHRVTIIFQFWILQGGWEVCYDVGLWLPGLCYSPYPYCLKLMCENRTLK